METTVYKYVTKHTYIHTYIHTYLTEKNMNLFYKISLTTSASCEFDEFRVDTRLCKLHIYYIDRSRFTSSITKDGLQWTLHNNSITIRTTISYRSIYISYH